jgi:hypothetical protein
LGVFGEEAQSGISRLRQPAFLLCAQLAPMTFSVSFKRCDGAALTFVCGMNVDCLNLNARVTEDVLDRERVNSGFGQTPPRHVAQVRESKILDLGVLNYLTKSTSSLR